MKVCVAGLWHLGTVTAPRLASGGPAAGKPPLFEPGLEDLVKAGLASGRLRFSIDEAVAAWDADIIWIAYDTPVDDEDRANVGYIIERTARVFPHVRNGALVLISSQVPVGTTKRLEQLFASEARSRRVGFGYSPENLRPG